MPFYIKGSVKSKYDMLMTVLNVSEPKRLTFGNLANRYFLALPDGKVEFEMLGENAGRGTITWLIPDGISHSVSTKVLSSNDLTTGSVTILPDNSVDIEIDNQGTLPAYPTFKFTHTSDNAYIGLAGENGVVALGSGTVSYKLCNYRNKKS